MLSCIESTRKKERKKRKKNENGREGRHHAPPTSTHHQIQHLLTNNYNNNNKKKCVFFNSICTFLLVFCSHKPSTSRKEISKRLKEIKENIKYTPEQIGCIIFFIQTETIIHRLHNSSRHLQIWRLVRCGSVNSELYRSHLRENVLAETCPSLCKR